MWVRLPPPALVSALIGALLLAACGGSTPGGQTSQGEGITAVEVVSGLDRPVGLATTAAEPGRLYVVEQGGTVRVVEDGRVIPGSFLDIGALVTTSPRGAFASEQGLLSLAFARDYARSGRLYVFYTDRSGWDAVVSYTARDGVVDESSAETVLRIAKRAERHHGGNLVVGPDGSLVVGIGDDGSPERAQSLEEGDLGGKIVRLGPDGETTTIAYGLRNPWRFSFDRKTGDLWVGDVGESRYEEVSRVERSAGLANLGWPAREGLHPYEPSGADSALLEGPGRVIDPVAEYGHETGCSVVGGHVYRGTAIPAARGRYFYGDYCTGVVWSVDPARPGEIRRELQLPVTLAAFGEDAAGELYLVSRTGTVYELRAA